MTIERGDVERVVTTILSCVPAAEYRLVGTASSLLRGIDTPASDVDILFRERDDVDAWVDALGSLVEIEATPAWLEDDRQYFARLVVDGVTVELSTVEFETDADTVECCGPGPWTHFDVIAVADGEAPAVRTELRLITEVARFRPDRYRPLIAWLKATNCDVGLVRRGLTGLDSSVVEAVLAQLS